MIKTPYPFLIGTQLKSTSENFVGPSTRRTGEEDEGVGALSQGRNLGDLNVFTVGGGTPSSVRGGPVGPLTVTRTLTREVRDTTEGLETSEVIVKTRFGVCSSSQVCGE